MLIVLAHLNRHALGIEQRNDGDIATYVLLIRLHMICLDWKLDTFFRMREEENLARPVMHLKLDGEIRDSLTSAYSRATHSTTLFLNKEGDRLAVTLQHRIDHLGDGLSVPVSRDRPLAVQILK